ncbi:hypothetical protein B0H13DRAFT_2271671 [Mycena leptocephala]|nr:hypothetical protein B0H13DRAFT_2271671 [Mycena leptocephala]
MAIFHPLTETKVPTAPLVPPLEAPQVLLDAESKTRRHARRHRGRATSHPLQNTFSTPFRGSSSSFGCWMKNAPTRAPSSREGDFSPPTESSYYLEKLSIYLECKLVVNLSTTLYLQQHHTAVPCTGPKAVVLLLISLPRAVPDVFLFVSVMIELGWYEIEYSTDHPLRQEIRLDFAHHGHSGFLGVWKLEYLNGDASGMLELWNQ